MACLVGPCFMSVMSKLSSVPTIRPTGRSCSTDVWSFHLFTAKWHLRDFFSPENNDNFFYLVWRLAQSKIGPRSFAALYCIVILSLQTSTLAVSRRIHNIGDTAVECTPTPKQTLSSYSVENQLSSFSRYRVRKGQKMESVLYLFIIVFFRVLYAWFPSRCIRHRDKEKGRLKSGTFCTAGGFAY